MSRYFYNLNFKYVHKHSYKAKKILKIPQGGGCATPPNVPKLDVSGVKDNAKIENEECHVAYR